MTTLSRAQSGDFAAPEETRAFDHGRLDLIRVEGNLIGRFQLDPGWRWSTDVKPLAGTDLCQNEHFAYHVSGTLGVRMADGTEFTVGPGQVTHVPPGHDAWVVGDETVTLVDWSGVAHYARH
ncbi:cupin domain-containing protein [Halostreptopolyspora alba]